ncbi:pyruvate kinase [Striga asiatica]|uniref:Pyruvate kinase n=1 Tax=Striga asiatica TaxID=4170 RepID=A0A5A7QXQ2_STRAF|nr:pyruvate kinase [Striga asiatica]
MAQVVATRLIHGSFAASTGSGTPESRVEKLSPSSGFPAKVLPHAERKSRRRGGLHVSSPITAVRSARVEQEVIPVSPEDVPKVTEQNQYLQGIPQLGDSSVGMLPKPNVRRKTKIVCTIGPSTNTKEMIWKLAEAGMNVARLNMSHGDHASHQKVIDLVKEYNSHAKDNVIAIMLDTKASILGPEVRSGDLPQPIILETGQEFTFTIQRGVGTADSVSVNYDDFVNDVEVGDMLLVDGGMMSLVVKSKTADSVKCEVVDGGELKSRRHLNVRGKSATLPSITEKDWDDIKFGVDNKVDFYAVSFVKDAAVVHELKNYLKNAGADIHVIVKIESADSIPNLHSIITASDGAMVARGDLGAELPIEEVPLLQEEIIRICRSMGKAVIVATNMLESMIVHPTPTRAEVSDIAIAVREGADAVMLSGETAHGKFPLKAVKVMHTVSLRTEDTIVGAKTTSNLGHAFKNHMSEMFAYHATMMSNTLGTSIVVFTRTGFMAILLSHFRPSGTIFAFTNEKRVQQRLALYQGVCPIHMEFSADAEDTFASALGLLQACSSINAL